VGDEREVGAESEEIDDIWVVVGEMLCVETEDTTADDIVLCTCVEADIDGV